MGLIDTTHYFFMVTSVLACVMLREVDVHILKSFKFNIKILLQVYARASKTIAFYEDEHREQRKSS